MSKLDPTIASELIASRGFVIAMSCWIARLATAEHIGIRSRRIVNDDTSAVSQDRSRYLFCRARAVRCAVPLQHVVEIMRPLPLQTVSGTPAFVTGAAVVRGLPTPVIDCGVLLGDVTPSRHTRWATIRHGGRVAALAFEEILGVRTLAAIEALPHLLRGSEALAAMASIDAELVLVLESARLVPESTWEDLAVQTATP